MRKFKSFLPNLVLAALLACGMLAFVGHMQTRSACAADTFASIQTSVTTAATVATPDSSGHTLKIKAVLINSTQAGVVVFKSQPNGAEVFRIPVPGRGHPPTYVGSDFFTSSGLALPAAGDHLTAQQDGATIDMSVRYDTSS